MIKGAYTKNEDGTMFVKVHPHSFPLYQMVCRKNPHLNQDDVNNGYVSLNNSIGLHHLTKLRNAAQAVSLQQDPPDASGPACTLFAESAEKLSKKRKVHFTLESQKQMKSADCQASIAIMAGLAPLKVLKPIHPRENLWIAYEEANVAAFITCLRDAGFDSSLGRYGYEVAKG